MSEVAPTVAVASMWIPCPRCAAMALGRAPHLEGYPCPQAVKTDEVYIAKLEAEREAAEATRDYYRAAAMPTLDVGEAMRALTRQLNETGDEG